MSKKVLILSDFVGFGNVAMSTARAVLTAMGCEVYCLPTAVFSNTFNLGRFAALDTKAYLQQAASVWQELGFAFDAVFVGYLADAEQAAWVVQQCQSWKADGAKVFFDPIFADNGRLYNGIGQSHITFLREMMAAAEVFLPNMTEAQLLAGMACQEVIADPEALLSRLGGTEIIITGAKTEQGCAVLYRGEALRIFPYDPVPGSFSGAGDLFSAIVIGEAMNQKTMPEAIECAMKKTAQIIRHASQDGWQGTGLPAERYFYLLN